MKTRILSAALLSASLFAFAACGQKDTQGPAAALDAKAVHEAVLTIDTHVDIPMNYMTDELDPGTATMSQVDLGKLETGGLDAAFFIVYTGQSKVSPEGIAKARATAETRFAAIKRMTETYPERIEMAYSAADVRRIHAAGKRVALIGMENAYPLGMTVDDVPMWAERGVRYCGITHMGGNQFGDSSNLKPLWEERMDVHGGLSNLGRELVTALNDYGIMVDVSHAGKATMMQATAMSRVPVIASHSGAKAIADNARNLDDEQLLAIKANGGVAQMVALGAYVKDLTPEQLAFRDVVRAEMGLTDEKKLAAMDAQTRSAYFDRLKPMTDLSPRASVSDFADHIDHAVNIMGIDHVGIASDFDGGGGIDGWDDASQTLNITAELVQRGYSQEEIAKIWGENLLRVMDAVEAGKKG